MPTWLPHKVNYQPWAYSFQKLFIDLYYLVEALAKRANATVIAKPVLLGGNSSFYKRLLHTNDLIAGLFQANNVKTNSFVNTLNPTKAKYTSLDLKR